MKRLLLLMMLLTATLRAAGAELTVHAAASLTDAMKELAVLYERAHPGDKLVFNFGGSNQLARQIREGAPGDLFFSADEAQMDGLDKTGQLLPGTRREALGNTLVFVVPNDSNLALTKPQDLTRPEFKKLAVAEPKSVPAGVYTREYLTKLKLWEAILPKVIPTENVRAALAAVESGNAEAAAVYKTDAQIARRSRIAFEVPAAEGPRIVYPLAVLQGSKQPEAARKLAAFLVSPEANVVFVRFGFLPIR